MQAILAVTVPFFALVLCGYLAARRHVLPESAIPGLNTFVLYFALPCLLFRFGASTPLHPLLVLTLGLAARALGAPLSGFQLMVLTLAAALPSASNVSLLAERYGADNGRIARIIMTTTVLSFLSFSGAAWLFGVQAAG